jgi:hypothetical protein
MTLRDEQQNALDRMSHFAGGVATGGTHACFTFNKVECGFRFIPAGYSDVKPATVPI